MIFWKEGKEGIDMIPSSYKIVVVDASKIYLENTSRLHIIYDKDNDDVKSAVKDFIKSNKYVYLIILNYIIKSSPATSIVFYEKHKTGLAREFAKRCAKRLDIKYYNFTNNITKDMVQSSTISNDIVQEILYKLIKVVKNSE